MRGASRWSVTLGSAAALLAAPVSAGPRVGEPACAGDEQEQKRCAKGHYAARRYVAAANAYAELWHSTGDSKYLYNSAVAREAAGSLGWALALWRRYRELPDIVPSEQIEADERITRLRAELVELELEITPLAALGDAAELHLARGSERFSYRLSALADVHGYRIHLDPGDWSLSVEPASHAAAYNRSDGPHALAVTIPQGASRKAVAHLRLVPETATLVMKFEPRSEIRRGVTIDLADPLGTEPGIHASIRGNEWNRTVRKGPWNYSVRPRGLEREVQRGTILVESPGVVEVLRWDPSAEVLAARRVGRHLSLGLGLAAGVSVVVGIGLIASGGQRIGATEIEGYSFVRRDEFRGRLAMSGWGGALFGGGLGLGTAAGLEALRPRRGRALAEMVAGGVVLAAGSVWLGMSREKLADSTKWIPSSDRRDLIEEDGTYGWRLSFAMSGALLGFGSGLVFGAVTGAITRKARLERSGLHASAGVGAGSVVLTVRGHM